MQASLLARPAAGAAPGAGRGSLASPERDDAMADQLLTIGDLPACLVLAVTPRRLSALGQPRAQFAVPRRRSEAVFGPSLAALVLADRRV